MAQIEISKTVVYRAGLAKIGLGKFWQVVIDFTCSTCDNEDYEEREFDDYEPDEGDIEDDIYKYLPFGWTVEEDGEIHCKSCSENFERTGMYMGLDKQFSILKNSWSKEVQDE